MVTIRPFVHDTEAAFLQHFFQTIKATKELSMIYIGCQWQFPCTQGGFRVAGKPSSWIRPPDYPKSPTSGVDLRPPFLAG